MPTERKYPYKQKVVSIGGGTGHFAWLQGVVKYNQPELNAAVVGTWDSGGSSGELRVKEGILPPGDYMQCLLALMENEEQLQEAIIILRDRTDGHPLVNRLAARSEKAHHGVEGGINGLRQLFRVNGQILPVSLIDTDLRAETRQGISLNQEHIIDTVGNNPNFTLEDEISRIYLDVSAEANPKVLSALAEADKIIFPPGSPYTSIFPHLLVNDIPDAILNSPGTLVAVLNLMTTSGEDHHLTTASRWLSVFQYYLRDRQWIEKTGRSRIDYLVVNANHINEEVLNIYQNQGQHPIEIDIDECLEQAPGIKIIPANLANYSRYSHILRHDPDILAKTVLAL